MKTPDFMSYDRYKNKKKNKSKNGVFIFITTFFVMLLFFSVVAKSLSPDVDVTIGDDSQTDAKESGLGVKKFIDERLKMIQMEDNSAGASLKDEGKPQPEYNDESFDKFSQNSDEKVNLPPPKDTSNMEQVSEEPLPSVKAPPRPSSKELSTPFEVPITSKVLVGRYSTLEQARVAQEILLDSGLNITPFIKDLGNSYTLQVGSYSSRAKAEGLASELQRNSFPARVVQE
ncbi:MAG: SPOR domain-containing protein [bacterium]